MSFAGSNLKFPLRRLGKEPQNNEQEPIASLSLSLKANMLLLAMNVRIVDQLLNISEKKLLESLKKVYEKNAEAYGLEGGFLEVWKELEEKLRTRREILRQMRKQADAEEKKVFFRAPIPVLAEKESRGAITDLAQKVLTPIPEEVIPQKQEEQTVLKLPTEERNEKVLANLGFVSDIVRRHIGLLDSRQDPALSRDDLWQAGVEGLILGVERWETSKKTCSFPTWIGWYIRKYVRKELLTASGLDKSSYFRILAVRKACERLSQDLDRSPTMEELLPELERTRNSTISCPWTAKRVEETFVEMHYWRHHGSLDEEIDEGNTRQDTVEADGYGNWERQALDYAKSQLSELILASSKLSPKHRVMIRLYCGFESVPHTLQEIGEIFGVCREMVRKELEKVFCSLRTEKLWREAKEVMPSLSMPTDYKGRKNYHPQKEMSDEQRKALVQHALSILQRKSLEEAPVPRRQLIHQLYVEEGMPFAEIRKALGMEDEITAISEFVEARKEALAFSGKEVGTHP
jgi:RNA polymerase primary sigma factor